MIELDIEGYQYRAWSLKSDSRREISEYKYNLVWSVLARETWERHTTTSFLVVLDLFDDFLRFLSNTIDVDICIFSSLLTLVYHVVDSVPLNILQILLDVKFSEYPFELCFPRWRVRDLELLLRLSLTLP